MSKHTSQENDKEQAKKHARESAGDSARDGGQTSAAADAETWDGAFEDETQTAGASAETTSGAGTRDAWPDANRTELDAKVASLNAELSNLKDQYLRKAAEFENFRKRMTKDKQDAIDFANQSLLLDLIAVIDDFERAIKSSESSRDFDAFYEGISLIEKRLVSQLENKWGLVRFESAGEPFDPNKHEAIMVEKTADVDEPTVGEDFVKGYTLKERVVRSAKVKVLMPEETADTDSSPAEGNGESAI